jgi:hypothetical protein
VTKLAILLFVSAGLLVMSSLIRPATTTAQQEPLRIVLETVDTGYHCTAGCDVVDFAAGAFNPVINVPLGTLVELHFVWAHQGYPNEEHVMVVEGYNVSSDLIDAHNRETTIRFIADKPGNFILKCDEHCELHDFMQRAQVRVSRESAAGGGGGASYTPTSLALTTSSAIVTGFSPVQLQAMLTEKDGKPIRGAELRFYAQADFGGVSGLVHIGSVRTDDKGAAQHEFRPFAATEEQKVVVRFAGMGVHDESEEQVTMRVTGSPPSAYTPDDSVFMTVRQFTRLSVVVVFLGLWTVLGFVFIQALNIGRVKLDE